MALDKSKKELVITGILIVVLALVSINIFSAKGKKQKEKARRKAAQVAQGSSEAVSKDASIQEPTIGGFAPPDQKVIQSQLLRIEEAGPVKDPFYPIGKKVTFKRGSIVLKGISRRKDGSSFAIINEQIVRVGDTVADSKVIRIEEKAIVLEKDKREYILMLEE